VRGATTRGVGAAAGGAADPVAGGAALGVPGTAGGVPGGGAGGPATATPQDGLARGTLIVMAAEALALPAGLVVTVLLTRHLPPPEYGALALALAAIAWLEWTVVSLFSRAAWKLVAEADDWRPVAAAVVRTFLLVSVGVAVVVFAAAGPVAARLGAADVGVLLRVLALEIPVFVAAQAYRTVLVGRGMHGSRAMVAGLRWTVRALLVTAGVAADAPLPAIAALIVAATVVELGVARWRAVGLWPAADVAPSAPPFAMRRLLAYAAPLAVSAICLRLFERIDIFALRLLGGSLESVAAYGVAQNLALMPLLFGGAFTPALIAASSYRRSRGDVDGARRLGSAALRAGFLVLPLVLLTAGAAPALIDLLFGARYAESGPLFAVLLAGAAGTLIIALAGGLLIAAGRLGWTIALAAPLLLVATAGHLFAIPRAGAIGAAVVTSGTALLGAAASCAAVHRLLGQPVPIPTLVRGLVLGAAAGWMVASFDVPAPALPFVLALLALLLAAAIGLTGELRPDERARLRAWRRPRAGAVVEP
jgi:O-antigen/teichoic acid export membrane protein